jgi:ABC-2 type transport system permease protein
VSAAAAAAPPLTLRIRRRRAPLLRFGLHAQRWWFVAIAFIGFVSPYSTGATFLTAAPTAAARASFGQATQTLGAALAYLIPLPQRPDTPAGYLWWKGLTWLTLIFAAWGLAAAVSLVRADEERGVTEIWLAAPVSRVRALLSGTAAFVVAATAAAAFTALGIGAGMAAADASAGALAVVGQCLPLVGIAAACFAIGLVAAQLATTRRGALVLGTIVLLVLYTLDALARVNPGVTGAATISPFHLADLTTSLVPGGSFDGVATGSMFALAAVLIALAAVGFGRRDLGSSLLPGRGRAARVTATPSANPLFREAVLSRLWQQRIGLVGWLAGTAIGAVLLVSLADGVGSLIKSTGGIWISRLLASAGTADPSLWVVSSIWFGVAALVIAAYAIAQVSRWASDDVEGRLEMEIAQPVARWQVVLQRVAALTVVSALIAAVGSLVTGAVLPSQGLDVGTGPLVLSTVLLVPLALTYGALGALIITRVPRIAVGLLAMIAVLGFYLPQLVPLFQWPGWVQDLSLFHLYGTPLTTGVFWTGLWVMLGIIVVGFGGAALAMSRREVGR